MYITKLTIATVQPAGACQWERGRAQGFQKTLLNCLAASKAQGQCVAVGLQAQIHVKL